jgi:beta-lactamase class C
MKGAAALDVQEKIPEVPPRRRSLPRIATLGTIAFALFGAATWGVTSGLQASPASGTEPPRNVADIVEREGGRTAIDYRRIDERLQRVAQEQAMVGLAVAIVEDGEIRFLRGYGETTEGSGDPVTPETMFRWASVSKGVAGDMLAKLAAEKKVSLYEPVSRYATTLRLPAGAENRATVADVLSHTLGLFAHAQDSKLEDGGDVKLLRQELAELNAICAPGQCHAYQNVAYDAASEVVEKVTGKPYEAAVREHLFLPLGMTSANMTRAGLVEAKSWAPPHVGGRPRPVEVTESYYHVPAAGGVNSSIKDMALWLKGQMGEDGILSSDVLENVRTPRALTPGENGRMRRFSERLSGAKYGLGWRIYDYAGHRVIGHRGGVRGYRSMIMYDPVRKTGVAALWNSASNKPSGLEFEVLDMLYQLPAKDWLKLDEGVARVPAA